MNIELALEKLFSLHTFGIKLGLENITCFLEYLGNPQKKLKAFHIAGSNGKGSTASFIASILIEFGYKVGLYTSPHFVKFNERIQINKKFIPDDYLAKFVTDYNDYIDEKKLTFFEVTTAIAFKYFSEQKVDYAVIETGLGGRLDATNVLNPLAVLITSISLEHTAILGSTIKDIAREKAGIIRNTTEVFTGRLSEDAENVIETKCRETNSKWYKIEDYVIAKGSMLELYTEEIELDDWSIPLRGQYQKFNAALAGLAVSKVLLKDDLKTISRGIRNVVKNTCLQGRFEYYSKKPDIIFDSAHNPEGIDNFLTEFKKDANKYSKRVLLFGVMKDKAIKGMLSNLNNSFDEIHITQVNVDRSSKIEELQDIADELKINVLPERNPAGFTKEFNNRAASDCLVVLGSMYLIGEIKSVLQKCENA
jgi:dihydrofolate synthase/folylpolyglutamate synthase